MKSQAEKWRWRERPKGVLWRWWRYPKIKHDDVTSHLTYYMLTGLHISHTYAPIFDVIIAKTEQTFYKRKWIDVWRAYLLQTPVGKYGISYGISQCLSVKKVILDDVLRSQNVVVFFPYGFFLFQAKKFHRGMAKKFSHDHGNPRKFYNKVR